MFLCGQEDSRRSLKDPKRRKSLADQSSSHHTDENVMSLSSSYELGGQSSGKVPPLQAKAFLQGAIPRPSGAHPVPPAPRRGGSGDAEKQIIESLEHKRRQHELESMVRSAEQENGQLKQQNRKLQADCTAESLRADAATAEATRLRAESLSARAEATRLRAELLSARAEATRLRAESMSARAESSRLQDQLANLRADVLEAKERADEVETTSCRVAVELAHAKDVASKANDVASRAKNEASREKIASSKATDAVSKANDKFFKIRQEKSQLCLVIETLAVQVTGETPSDPTLASTRLGGALSAGISPKLIVENLPAAAPRSRESKTVSGGPERLIEFIETLRGLVSDATGRDLSPTTLHQFLAVPSRPSGGRGKCDGDRDAYLSVTGAVPQSVEKAKVKSSTPRKEKLVLPLPPPVTSAAAVSTVVGPTEKVENTGRHTTTRRKMLDARRAHQASEKQRIKEEQERERVERQREAREKRKKAAARQLAAQASVTARVATKGKHSSQTSLPLMPKQVERQTKAPRAQPVKIKQTSQAVQGNSMQSMERQQQQVLARLLQSQGNSGFGGSRNPAATNAAVEAVPTAHLSCLAETPATTISSSLLHGKESPIAVATASAKSARGPESHEETEVEEVPMPIGDVDDGYFCAGSGWSPGRLFVAGTTSGVGVHRPSSEVRHNSPMAAVGDGVGKEEAVQSRVASPLLGPLVEFVIGQEDLLMEPSSAHHANKNVGVSPTASKTSAGKRDVTDRKKKRRRSLRLANNVMNQKENNQSAGSEGGKKEMCTQDGTEPLPSKQTTVTSNFLGSVCTSANRLPKSTTEPLPSFHATGAATITATGVPAEKLKRKSTETLRQDRPKLDLASPKPVVKNKRPRAGAGLSRSPQPFWVATKVTAIASATTTSSTTTASSRGIPGLVLPVAKSPSAASASPRIPLCIDGEAAKVGIVLAAVKSCSQEHQASLPTATGESEPKVVETFPVRHVVPEPASVVKAEAVAVVVEALPPLGVEMVASITTEEISQAARSWFVGYMRESPGGALIGVVAAGRVLMEKCVKKAGLCSSSVPSIVIIEHLRSLLAAIVAAESCAIRHQFGAGAETAVAAGDFPVASGAGKKSFFEKQGGARASVGVGLGAMVAGNAKPKKRVRFCAFDLSSVDMPSDAIQDSDVPAKDVAECLGRVVASSRLLQNSLREAMLKRKGGDRSEIETWRAFLSGVCTVAVAMPPTPLIVAKVKAACLELGGGEVSGESVTRAAAFLLGELKLLESAEEPIGSPMRLRLAGMLSSLVRFNLRVLLNPPPPTRSAPGVYDESRKASSNNHSKVYEVVWLAPEDDRLKRKGGYDPTREQATSAFFSRALRRLYGYSDQEAERVVTAAERFTSGIEIGGNNWFSSDEEIALRARQHSLDAVDIVAAIRARSFVLELLEFPGVEAAIEESRGWGEVERLSAALQEVKDSPDADASFTLLADVQGLKKWLKVDSVWRHDAKARAVLTKLDKVLVNCNRKEAIRLSQEARRRIWFPPVKAALPLIKGPAI